MTCARCHQPICGHSDLEYQGVVADLARAKVLFQQRAICVALGINQSSPSPHLTGDDTPLTNGRN